MAYKLTALHPIEKKILELVGNDGSITIETLSDKSVLTIDQVRRGVERLKFKKLILISQDFSVFFESETIGSTVLIIFFILFSIRAIFFSLIGCQKVNANGV